MNKTQIERNIRRILEMRWTRNQLKKLFIIGFCLLILLIYFICSFLSYKSVNYLNKCTIDQLNKFENFNYNNLNNSVSFVGNGFIGIDVALDQQLIISSNNSLITKQIFTYFFPLIEMNIYLQTSEKFYFITDFQKGVSRGIKCFVLNQKCVCLYQMVYTHRTRPNLLINELHITNPTSLKIELSLNRRGNSNWEQAMSGSSPVYLKKFNDSESIFVAIICSTVSRNKIIVSPQTEQNFRFLCVIETEQISLSNSNEEFIKKKLSGRAKNRFTILNALKSNKLDFEHYNAWKTINRGEFDISHSKLANALNIDKINLTRYVLLSTVRAPIIEIETKSDIEKQKLEKLLEQTELCYSSHSTLLTPSKLWQVWSNVFELLRTVEIWFITLEHCGCVYLFKAGAHGVLQSFLLSLLAGTFTHHRLEIGLNPELDLYRNIRVENLRVDLFDIGLNFDLDENNKPFVEIKINSKINKEINENLYACSTGCLNMPQQIGAAPIRFFIKITKPSTPILFIANNKKHLTQIKDTLHVAEVLDVPVLETHKIDMHKHGESNSILKIFWIILICLLIAFHCFLFKILYTEWNYSTINSYSKLNKNFILNGKHY